MSTTDRMGTVPVLDLPMQERHGYRGRQVLTVLARSDVARPDHVRTQR